MEMDGAVFEEAFEIGLPLLPIYNGRSGWVYLELEAVDVSAVDFEFSCIHRPIISVDNVLCFAVGVNDCSCSAVAYC